MRKEKNIQTTTQLFEQKEIVFAQRMTNFMNKKKQKKMNFKKINNRKFQINLKLIKISMKLEQHQESMH